MQQQVYRNFSSIMNQKPISSPQVGIYNRNFYLRGAQHNLKQAQYVNQVKQLANKPKISISSYNILCQQLEDRMMEIFQKYCGRKNQQGGFLLESTKVTFLQLQSIVAEACQINSGSCQSEMEHFLSQLWLILGEYQILSEIKANLLYASLRIFMDPYNLNEAEYMDMLNNIDQFKRSSQNRQVFLKEYPQLSQETLTVNEVIKLWKKIRYSNPLLTKVNSKVKQLRTQYAFHPEINKKSELLASKSMKKYLQTHQSALNRTLDPSRKYKKGQNQLSRYLDNSETYEVENSKYFSKPSFHDILYQRKLQKDEMPLKTQKDQSFYSSQVSRTAKPDQIREIVNNLYVVRQKRQDTDFVKKDEQQQLKQCTFSPKINKNFYGSRSSVSPAVKGYDKQVNRVHKGRQQKQKKKLAYENLGRVKNFARNYSKSPNTNRSSAPSFIDRDTPKLILEINIDGERIEKLSLKGNQDPHLVSKKFVIKHGLQDQMIEVLQALVEQQLKNL